MLRLQGDPTMKHALPFVLATVIMAPIATAAETFHSDGGFISFTASDSRGHFSADVLEGTEADGTKSASIHYSAYRCSSSGCETISYGSGSVPPSMVTFSQGPGAPASINIPDIAALPNVNRYGPLQSGAINVTVTRDGSDTEISRGTSTRITPAYRVVANGSSELGYGVVKGSMFGVTLPTGAGSSGTNRNMSVTITRK